MLSIESFGEYLRGFDATTGTVEDEPRKGLETVLTVRFAVQSDLEPVWSLFSERTTSVDPPRGLPWKERAAIAPSRLGNHPSSNLSWNKGSVLNRLSEERADIGAELVQAAREARAGFGAKAAPQLAATLKTVTDTANDLGVSVGLSDDVQSTIRCFPEAFLAKSVIVCEGASEVGLIRGLDARTKPGRDIWHHS